MRRSSRRGRHWQTATMKGGAGGGYTFEDKPPSHNRCKLRHVGQLGRKAHTRAYASKKRQRGRGNARVVQVAREAVLVQLVRFHPLHAVGEVVRLPGGDLLRGLAGEVHLDNLPRRRGVRGRAVGISARGRHSLAARSRSTRTCARACKVRVRWVHQCNMSASKHVATNEVRMCVRWIAWS
jgi:hypothetical protein